MLKNYFTSKNITRIAVFTALSVVLYLFVKFPLPIFPSFLELQISDLPALLAGFMMGQVGGTIVLVLRTLIKLPFTKTACVGEIADLLIGLAFVLVSAFVYRRRRTIKGAIGALCAGVAATTVAAMIVNRVILIPFYSAVYGFEAVVGMVKAIFPSITDETFYAYYIFGAVLPFNLMRSVICAALAFVLYKRLKVLFDRLFEPEKRKKSFLVGNKAITKSEKQTERVAVEFSSRLKGGEVILLRGELGAGKTVFVRGLCKGLGLSDRVTSPTFALMNEYGDDKLRLVHIDAYRLKNAREAYEAGLAEYLYAENVVVCVEWAENIAELLDGENVEVDIKYLGENEREIVING